MLVKLVKIKFNYTTGKYALEELAVNPEHVMCVTAEEKISQEIRVYEHRRPAGLDSRISLSKVTLRTGTSHIVVGDMVMLAEKLGSSILDSKNRRVLKG